MSVSNPAPGSVSTIFFVPRSVQQAQQQQEEQNPGVGVATGAGTLASADISGVDGFSAAAAPIPAASPSAVGPGGEETRNGVPPAMPHLTYRGGAVLDHAVLNSVYLGDYWKSAPGQSDQQHLDAFAQEFGCL